MLRYLLSVGGDINIKDSDGDIPLFCCEDVDTFQYLIANHANMKHINNEGQNLLLKLISDENDDFIVYLIEREYYSRSDLPIDYKFPNEREQTIENDIVEMEAEVDTEGSEGEGPTQEQVNAAFLEWVKTQGADSITNMEQDSTTTTSSGTNNTNSTGQL